MSWRRATAPPFDTGSSPQRCDNNNFIVAATSPQNSNNVASSTTTSLLAGAPIFRRRLEQALQNQVVDGGNPFFSSSSSGGSLNSFNQQPFMISSGRGIISANSNYNAVSNIPSVQVPVAPLSGIGQQQQQQQVLSPPQSTSAPSYDIYAPSTTQQQQTQNTIETQVTLAAVAGVIDSARQERDTARKNALVSEIQAMQSRREAADAANTALSSYRQHGFLENSLRSAEAQIADLQRRLEAEAQHSDNQMLKASQLQHNREQQLNSEIFSEKSLIESLQQALEEKDAQLQSTQKELEESKQLVNETTKIFDEKKHEYENLEQQMSAVSTQKSDLTSFYEKTVTEHMEEKKQVEKQHKEQIVNLQAEHTMQRVRWEETLTRCGISEESARQSLQLIHTRLAQICSNYNVGAFEHQQQQLSWVQALDELRAASANALQGLDDEKFGTAATATATVSSGSGRTATTSEQQQQQKIIPTPTTAISSPPTNLAIATAGPMELRSQVKRLQGALEQVTDDRGALQNRADMLFQELAQSRTELNEIRESARNSSRHENVVGEKRQELAKETSDRVIDDALTDHQTQIQRQLHSHQQQMRDIMGGGSQQRQQQQSQRISPPRPHDDNNSNSDAKQLDSTLPPTNTMINTSSPRIGSVAARFHVVSVRGLQPHPDLVGKKIKICALAFGSIGQQLCDVECDEDCFDLSSNSSSSYGNSSSTRFSQTSMHFEKDSRFPVTVYLHSADPGVIVVHFWARVEGDSTIPRKFLGCASLHVADVLSRGPGQRVLRLSEREPHEPDVFIRAAHPNLGFVTVDVGGPFISSPNSLPLQNDSLANTNSSSSSAAAAAAAIQSKYRSPRSHYHPAGVVGGLNIPTNVPPLMVEGRK